jgi:hypothetical protein
VFCWGSGSGLAFHVESELGILVVLIWRTVFGDNGNVVCFKNFKANMPEFRGLFRSNPFEDCGLIGLNGTYFSFLDL